MNVSVKITKKSLKVNIKIFRKQPFFLAVGTLLVILLAGFAYVNSSKKVEVEENNNGVETSSSPTPDPTTTSPKPKTANPTPTPLTTSTSQPISNTSSATCGINFLTDTSSDLAVKLVYSVSSTNGTYMSAAQWDFDGNGSWDTDLSSGNGTLVHTYSSAGTYSPRLQLKMSDGKITNPCQASVTVPYGLNVSLTGTVYEDINCNYMREPSEKVLPGVRVVISDSVTATTYADLTTNSSGYYSFNKKINPQTGITVTPHDYPLPDYGSNNRNSISLNSAQPSINMDLGQIPAPVASYCD